MSIRKCRAVQAIADHGSFAEAASRLNVTQSAISMQITSFEERLGVMLFDRSFRPPRLTDAGRTVLTHARKIVAEYDGMLEALSEGHGYGGALRIGVVPTVVTSLLPSALMRLRERGAAAPTVTVTSALSGDLAAAVERGDLDAALIHEPRALPPGYVWREVSRQKIVVIAPAATRETSLTGLFASQPYIRFNRAAWVAPLIEKRLKEMGLEPNATAEIQSIDAINHLVSLGFGVSVVPSVAGAAENPSVKTLEFGEPPLFRSIGFIMPVALADRPIARIVGDAFAAAARA